MRPVSAAVLGASLCLTAVAGIGAETAPLFSQYPSYGAKFDIDTEKFSLVSSVVVYNISGQPFTDVTFKQSYPEGVTVKETYQRELGTEATGEQSSARNVENNVFYARMPTFKNRQYVVIFNELSLARRLNQIAFPGIEITYTDPQGQTHTTKLQDSTYDLYIYSNVVGGLERFLRKYNNIGFDFKKAVPERKGWEFASIAPSAQGRFPTGIIGTFNGDDQYNGYFRIRNGPPGDSVQVVVVYKATDKQEKVADRDGLMKKLREYMRWCGEFEVIPDGLQVQQAEWKKYKDVWIVDGRWRDTIKNRLGEGILKARVFYSAREAVEYVIVALGQGRGYGADSSVAAPEKEAKLAAELDRLLDTFKSEIVPHSYERRP